MSETENLYEGREQSQAKHFILKRYLAALAFKVLGSYWDDLTYVDGFSGPWESKADDFSDTSFMIAISVLKGVQDHYRSLGQHKNIKCYFIEKDPGAYAQLEPAVMAHHNPGAGFSIKTACSEFERVANDVAYFMRDSFALTFIDPTGWTGYGFESIAPVLMHRPGEVLINVMYDHMNRFISSKDPETIASFSPILGGENWQERLDPDLSKGAAVLKLLCSEFETAGGFRHVVATKIDQATADRPHYFLAYGTRNWNGLKAFRDAEYTSLKDHEQNRLAAKLAKKEAKSGQSDLFGPGEAQIGKSFDALVADQMEAAKPAAIAILQKRGGVEKFDTLAAFLMTDFMLRLTNVKTVIKELADVGLIEATWKQENSRRQKPNEDDLIVLKI